jgi:hypothetical protein
MCQRIVVDVTFLSCKEYLMDCVPPLFVDLPPIALPNLHLKAKGFMNYLFPL